MTALLKQSTAVTIKLGPFVDSADGNTDETGLTISQADVRLTKNGGNMAQKNEATSCTHDELGYYNCPLDATDTNTLGILKVIVHESGALHVWDEYMVVPANVYDSLVGGSDTLQADVTQWLGTAAATPSVAGVPEVDLTHILGHLLTQVGTQVADAFESFFNVATPTGTVNSLPAAAPDGAGGLPISDAGGLALDTQLANTNEITVARMGALTDWINGGRLDLILDIIAADVVNIDGAAMRGTNDAATAAKLLAYIQLLARSDAAIETDNATELTEINADGGSGAGDFSSQTDSEEGLRDRGDAAWTTGGGGSISDILNIQPLIPGSIDLANTATVRIGLGLSNALDDLPTTVEITPGTITIDRKAVGGTSWTNVVNAATCSEAAGLVYYDEVFDSGTGYAAGDSIRITFKSQKITVAANDYEVTGTDGWVFQTEIRETMRGTDGANTTTPPTVSEIQTEMEENGASVLDTLQDRLTSARAGYLDELAAANIPADIDTLIARLTAARAGNLDELGATNIPADVDSLLARLTAARAGYLDKLNVTGTLAHSDAAATYKATGFSTHAAADIWSVATRILTANTNLNDPTAAAIATAVVGKVIDGTIDMTECLKVLLAVLAGDMAKSGDTYTQEDQSGATKVTSVVSASAVERTIA